MPTVRIPRTNRWPMAEWSKTFFRRKHKHTDGILTRLNLIQINSENYLSLCIQKANEIESLTN